MTEQWYYVSRGQQVGPVAAEAVRQAAAAGQLHGTDVVWREGMADWAPLSAVPELLPPGGIPLGYGVMNYGTPEVTYAGFWLRFVAWVIDAVIGAVAGGIVGAIIGGIAGAAGAGPGTPAWGNVKVGIDLMSTVIGWLYAALMESSSMQATVGKMALGLRVTDLDGRRISFGRATGRHFGKIVSGLVLMIGFIMAGFTERKQALHDIMAGTLVVKR